MNLATSAFGLILLFDLCVVKTFGLCLGSTPPTCLESMEEAEVTEKLNYVLSKYEEVEMKLIGTPLGASGNRITHGETEELNINFRYIDNTLHDIIQSCVFVLLKQPGECETISTVCNTFLPITPRPLLARESLTVCDDDDDDDAGAEEQDEAVKAAQDAAEVATQATNAEARNDSELI